jgi:hypothetical protein
MTPQGCTAYYLAYWRHGERDTEGGSGYEGGEMRKDTFVRERVDASVHVYTCLSVNVKDGGGGKRERMAEKTLITLCTLDLLRHTVHVSPGTTPEARVLPSRHTQRTHSLKREAA